jgi:pullulanase/glycogen debranching enzyme
VDALQTTGFREGGCSLRHARRAKAPQELTWFDWSAPAQHCDLVEFTARLCRLREAHPVFRRRQFFSGTPAPETTRDDLDWFRPDGGAMTPQDWGESYVRAVTMALSGVTGDDARPDDPFLWMLNAWWEPLDFSVPESLRGPGWLVEVDTGDPGASGSRRPVTRTARETAGLSLGCSSRSRRRSGLQSDAWSEDRAVVPEPKSS